MAQQAYKYIIRFNDEHGHTHERTVIATSFREAWLSVFVEALTDNITPVNVDLQTQHPVGLENNS